MPQDTPQEEQAPVAYSATYTLTKQEYLNALAAKERAYPDKKKQIVSGVLVLALLLYVTPFLSGQFTVAGVIAVALMLVVLAVLWCWPIVQKHQLVNQIVKEDTTGTVNVYRDKVEFVQKNSAYQITVQQAQNLLETKYMFLVTKQDDSSILIPKVYFKDDFDNMTLFFESIFKEKYHYIHNSYFRFLPSRHK